MAQKEGEDLVGKSLDRPEAPAKDSLGQVLESGAEGLGHHRCFLWVGMGELRHYLLAEKGEESLLNYLLEQVAGVEQEAFRQAVLANLTEMEKALPVGHPAM